MQAKELIRRYAMEAHPEQGLFVERHYASKEAGRPASGSIYYYVAPGEHTEFHQIDCDEYWVYNAGATLELWVLGTEGTLRRQRLGTEPGAELFLRLAKGEIFASRLPAAAGDGCMVTCITVPRFTYAGFRMFPKEEMVQQYPETAGFYEPV